MPDEWQLKHPEEPVPLKNPSEYTRVFPLYAQKVIDRGYSIPAPIGLSTIGVYNSQKQHIANLSLSLSKGGGPFEELALTPFVTLKDVIITTASAQATAYL